MNVKVFLLGITLMSLVSSPAFSQQAPPTSEVAKHVEVLVNAAAALIDTQGKTPFTEFRKKNGVWYHGDIYLFVYDLDGNVLFNPAFPQREGTNVVGQKEANGKLFHDAMIEVAKTKGSGWVDYMFPKPGQTAPSQKWTYVKKVTVDGVPGLVAAGFYSE